MSSVTSMSAVTRSTLSVVHYSNVSTQVSAVEVDAHSPASVLQVELKPLKLDEPIARRTHRQVRIVVKSDLSCQMLSLV